MKKDKKWFIDKWTKERNKTDVHDPMYHFINEFIADVEQFDEPEVLSQEWIDEHKVSRINNLRKMTMSDVVPVDKLQDLLVPKQEITFYQVHDKLREESILSEKSFDYYWNCINDNVEIDEPGNLIVPKQELPVIPKHILEFIIRAFDVETTPNTIETLSGMTTDRFLEVIKDSKLVPKQKLPVVPKYVAEWIESPDRDLNDMYLCERPKNVYEWTFGEGDSLENSRYRDLLDAIENGYEVEDEQKYYVINNQNYFLLAKDKGHGFVFSTGGNSKIGNTDNISSTFKLTEQEIKDYDERYWTFAVKVEEVK